jgi:hypothetical protein
MNKICRVLCCLFLLTGQAVFLYAVQAQSSQPTANSQASPPEQPAQPIPVIDGEAGPCSLDLTVADANGRPAPAVNVKVHIGYGFAGVRRLDLEIGTNAAGKARFIGLPASVHRPPLQFNASNGKFSGMVVYDPADECNAKHDLVLDKPIPQPASGGE